MTVNQLQSAEGRYVTYKMFSGEPSVIDTSRPHFNIERYGAVGDGIVDCTTAIRNARDAARTTAFTYGGDVLIPFGTFLVTGAGANVAVLFDKDRDRVVFQGGPHKSVILFNPSAGSGECICFQWKRDNSGGLAPLAGASCVNATFLSTDTTKAKVAVDLWDVSTFKLDMVCIGWTGSGNISSGLRTHGHDMSRFGTLSIYADKPIDALPNPNYPTLAADHFRFNDVELVALDKRCFCIEFTGAVCFSNLIFDGHVAMGGGRGGIKFLPVGSPTANHTAIVRNLRYEEPDTTTTAVTSITRVGAVATVTKTAHALDTGDLLTITGATQTEYNVTRAPITVIDANTFTFAVAGTPATPATGSPVYRVAAWAAKIAGDGGSYSVKFDSCNFGGTGLPTNDGVYARNVIGLTLDNCEYTGAGVAINADGASVENVLIQNSHLAIGIGTLELTNLQKLWAIRPNTGTIGAVEFWMTTSTGSQAKSLIFHGVNNDFQTGTLGTGVGVHIPFDFMGFTSCEIVLTAYGAAGPYEACGRYLLTAGACYLLDTGKNAGVGTGAGKINISYGGAGNIQVYNGFAGTVTFVARYTWV